MKTLTDSLQESFEILSDVNTLAPLKGITTGFCALDTLLRGMQQGALSILTSLSPSDQIAFALNVVYNHIKNASNTRILFCSEQSNIELAFRLLTVASGIKDIYNFASAADELTGIFDSVNKMKDYPLFFEDFSELDDMLLERIKTIHSEQKIELLIIGNICPEYCFKLKGIAKKLNIAILALVPLDLKNDKDFNTGIADTLITLHLANDAAFDSCQGVPAELTISKNKHGLTGTIQMCFIPDIMLFKENCVDDTSFVIIPEQYEPVSPYTELKKYFTPDNLPLLEHLHSEIPTDIANTSPDILLSLSASLEGAGDHENAVKVFKLGQKSCEQFEENIETVYDLLRAAMYYWIFRQEYKMHGCMARAEQILDERSQLEYNELKQRILTYKPSSWIKDEDLEDPDEAKKRFRIKIN